MIGIFSTLNPILIEEYDDTFELLVVEIRVAGKEIRIISGCGPQETWKESERMPFFLALEKEIVKAEMENKSVMIAMDANSKLGPDVVPGDPHPQSPNGVVLYDIIERHQLVVANSLVDKAEGVITRRRVTKDDKEESVIDFIIISKELKKYLQRLIIDEDRKFILKRIVNLKGGKVKRGEYWTNS